MFRTFANLGINIKMISTSEVKISCLVDQDKAQEAVEALHTIFGLDSNEIAEVKGDLPNV
jgi:aspartate kinase